MLPLPAMDPKHQSIPEAGAYHILKVVLADLVKAERALALVQEGAPDSERGTHLDHVRMAISAVRAVVSAESEGVT